MMNIGQLPEDVVRRDIEKLIRLMGIKRELKNKIPINALETTCLPIQREAVAKEIRDVVRYLRKWRVNIKACVNGDV